MSQFRNTILLLRFPFSAFLLPVSLFSFYFIEPQADFTFFILLFIWHFLVFPASNGYNSYHDRDTGPIGALTTPPQPTGNLLTLVNAMDASAVLLSGFINILFGCFVLVYILASRAYSNRKIRLKKYPFISFLLVFIFQGAWVFCANFYGLDSSHLLGESLVILAAIISSFLIGTIYPLTQIYQHESDKKDNVQTFSMVLGKKGTFVFTALSFAFTVLLMMVLFKYLNSVNDFWLFNVIMLPATLFFLYWATKSFRSNSFINHRNTMIMLILSALLNNLFFIILLLK